jgi:cytidylate kinase
MPTRILPSVEQRLAALQEIHRRTAQTLKAEKKFRPIITISREFGCEALPLGLKLRELMEKKTGDQWTLMDKELLEKIAGDMNLLRDIFVNIEDEHKFIDEVFSTFSSTWKSHKDYYRELCLRIYALAKQGNVVFVGRGSSVIAQKLPHSYHFRLVAPYEYRVNSIVQRGKTTRHEAEEIVARMQNLREKFIKDFLNCDIGDPYLYHMIFNNARNTPERIADIISDYVTSD